MKKKLPIVLILAVVIFVFGSFGVYCADSSNQKFDSKEYSTKRREEIQKGYDGGKTIGFMKWGADISGFPQLTLKDSDQKLPQLKRYIDPESQREMEMITRMLGVPPMPSFYIFCENKFCGVEIQGLTFNKTEEMENSLYGHWTHLEDLARPYYGRCWRIGDVDISLIGSTGESWATLFIQYMPLNKKFMPNLR